MPPRRAPGKEPVIPLPVTNEADLSQIRPSPTGSNDKGSDTSSVRKESDDDNLDKTTRNETPASGVEHNIPMDPVMARLEETIGRMNQTMVDNLSYRMEEAINDTAQKVTAQVAEVMRPMSLSVQQNSDNMSKQVEKLVNLLSDRLGGLNDRPGSMYDRSNNFTERPTGHQDRYAPPHERFGQQDRPAPTLHYHQGPSQAAGKAPMGVQIAQHPNQAGTSNNLAQTYPTAARETPEFGTRQAVYDNNPQRPITRGEALEMFADHAGATFRPPSRPMYRPPYPAYVDRTYEFPPRYKFPDFKLFSGEDKATTLEHIGRFTIQCGELGSNEFMKLRLFASSLTGAAYQWYINLHPDSVRTWADLERMFHMQFYKVIPEVNVTDMARLHQFSDEKVEKFIARFNRSKVQCRASLSEADYVKIAQDGLRYDLRKKFAGVEFIDLCHLVSAVSRYERIAGESPPKKAAARPNYREKMVNHVEYEYDSDTSEDTEEAEVAVAELMRGRPYTCKALTKPAQAKEGEKIAKSNTAGRPERKFEFDVTKTEQIFDLMLKDKLIRLPDGHKIPSKDELKSKRYCKWHDLWTHDTNNCVSLRIAIQGAIKEGDLKFAQAGVHAVDDNPFPEVAMVGTISVETTAEESRGKRPVEGESSRRQDRIGGYKSLSASSNGGRQQSKEDKPREGAFRGQHPESEWISPEEIQRYCNMNGRPMYCAGCNRGLAKPVTIQRRPAWERLGSGEERKRARPENFTTTTRESRGVRFEVKLPVTPKSSESKVGLGADASRPYHEGRMDRPKIGDRFRSLARARKNTGRESLPDKYEEVRMAKREYHLSRDKPGNRDSGPYSYRHNVGRAEKEKLYRPVSPRFVTPKVDDRPIWRRVVHPKFPGQGSGILTRTQKRRLQRSLAETRRMATEKRVRYEGKPRELVTVKERLEASNVKTEIAALENITEEVEDDMDIESSGRCSPLGSSFEVLTDSDSDGDYKSLEQLSIQFGSQPQKAPVNMVSVLPFDFKAKDEQSDGLMDDVNDETEPALVICKTDVMAVEENKVTFEKPEGKAARHLKPLYIKIHLDGKPVSRVLVDNGAAINIITTSMMRRLGKQDCELKPAPMTIMNFMGKAEKSKGILVAEVTVGEKTKTTGFYVVDAAANYNILLGRDWIHTSLCVPSSLHQCLLLWNGNQVEKVMADDQPFENSANMAEIKFYNGEFIPTEYTEGSRYDISEQAVLGEDFSWF